MTISISTLALDLAYGVHVFILVQTLEVVEPWFFSSSFPLAELQVFKSAFAE